MQSAPEHSEQSPSPSKRKRPNQLIVQVPSKKLSEHSKASNDLASCQMKNQNELLLSINASHHTESINLSPRTSVLPSNRKKKSGNSAFITQNPNRKLSASEQVAEYHNELNSYIENMEHKVQRIIESHDSQFLLAYRTHVNRVREQMQELKNKTTKDANSASTHTEKIETLEKELIIFREEALTLFDKLTQKDKHIELLQMRIYELQTEEKFNKKTVSDLMKRNKYLESFVSQSGAETAMREVSQVESSQQRSVNQEKERPFFEAPSTQGLSVKKHQPQTQPLEQKAGYFKKKQNSVGNSISIGRGGASRSKGHSFYIEEGQPQPSEKRSHLNKDSRPVTTAIGSRRKSSSYMTRRSGLSSDITNFSQFSNGIRLKDIMSRNF